MPSLSESLKPEAAKRRVRALGERMANDYRRLTQAGQVDPWRHMPDTLRELVFACRTHDANRIERAVCRAAGLER
jgi:hypothetical protein